MEWLVPLNKTNVYGRDERGLSSAHTLLLLGPVVEQTTGCQWGCSGINYDSGTKSSLGPNFYFTGGLIYSQNPTLGYVLLVPPMPLTVALACRQVICISTLPRPLYS